MRPHFIKHVASPLVVDLAPRQTRLTHQHNCLRVVKRPSRFAKRGWAEGGGGEGGAARARRRWAAGRSAAAAGRRASTAARLAGREEGEGGEGDGWRGTGCGPAGQHSGEAGGEADRRQGPICTYVYIYIRIHILSYLVQKVDLVAY